MTSCLITCQPFWLPPSSSFTEDGLSTITLLESEGLASLYLTYLCNSRVKISAATEWRPGAYLLDERVYIPFTSVLTTVNSVFPGEMVFQLHSAPQSRRDFVAAQESLYSLLAASAYPRASLTLAWCSLPFTSCMTLDNSCIQCLSISLLLKRV